MIREVSVKWDCLGHPEPTCGTNTVSLRPVLSRSLSGGVPCGVLCLADGGGDGEEERRRGGGEEEKRGGGGEASDIP